MPKQKNTPMFQESFKFHALNPLMRPAGKMTDLTLEKQVPNTIPD
jgi:hypothetical protein